MTCFKRVMPQASGSADGLTSTTTILSLEEIKEIRSFEEPLRLYHIWQDIPKEQSRIDALKPETFGPSLLPHMYILDVTQDAKSKELDFRWRLFGSAHTDRYRKEATGSCLSEAAGRYSGAASSYKVAQNVYEHRQAVFYMNSYFDDSGPVRSTSTVALPLMNGSGKVTQVFGCSIWQSLKAPS